MSSSGVTDGFDLFAGSFWLVLDCILEINLKFANDGMDGHCGMSGGAAFDADFFEAVCALTLETIEFCCFCSNAPRFKAAGNGISGFRSDFVFLGIKHFPVA